jgi:lysophospholipase L1-like esterase
VKPPVVALILLLLAWTSSFADDKPPRFELLNGDRVVLIGGTMIERDQTYGYLETRLTRCYPDRPTTFRNLGWSGDTVEGVSRAGFGPPGDGYKQLVDHVLALKPTRIIIGYGANESFEGQAGLPKFVAGLDKLLKAFEPTLDPNKASVVFVAPNRQEDLGPPLPNPSAHNADLALYRDAIRKVSQARWKSKSIVDRFVDLFDVLPDGPKAKPPLPLTDNGIHFNAYGYWRAAAAIESEIANTPGLWRITIDRKGLTDNNHVSMISFNMDVTTQLRPIPGGAQFEARSKNLPPPPPPVGYPGIAAEARIVIARNFDPGKYTLKIDGKPVASADAAAWEKGVEITKGPEFDQVEALRQAINAKNELYFYRWRPQNETYLFGFRKHEQGQNAREIPLFDPLVEAKEAEIAKLRVPVPHLYELIREGEAAK